MIPHSRPWINSADEAAVLAILRSGQVARGVETERFESRMARALGREAAIAMPSGTSALALALRMVGVVPRSEVIVPTYVCGEVATAVESLGAIAVVCDVRDDWCIDPLSAAAVRTAATTAVIAPHVFGITADIRGLRPLGLPIVEDLAQALGGSGPEGPVGSLGDVAVCSFHATKVLCTGEGGLVAASTKEVNAARAKSAGLRMSDLSAALGVAQLDRLDQMIQRRRELAMRYLHELRGLPCDLPVVRSTMWFRFPIRVSADVATLIGRFGERGVSVRRGVDQLLHPRAEARSPMPVAESLYQRTLSLPLYPSLTDAEAGTVIRVARELLG